MHTIHTADLGRFYLDQEFINRNRLQPYEFGRPAALTPAMERVDRTYGARYCTCGYGRQREYRPFHRGDRYRAFSVCPHCGHEEEF